MESSGNVNNCTPPSAADAADADLIYYQNPASVNNSAKVNCISEGSPLIPVIVSDIPCPPTICYFSYRDLYQQANQMRRLNEEVDPNGSHKPLCNVADTSMANSMPSAIENSTRVVNSISDQPVNLFIPTTYQDDNEDIYDYLTTPGSAEDLLKMSSDNYPVDSGLKEVHQHDPGMLGHLQFDNTHQNLGCFSLPNHPSNNMRRLSSQENPVDPAASSRCRIPTFSTFKQKTSFGLHLNSIVGSLAPSEPKNTESGMPNVVKPVSEYEASELEKAPLNQIEYEASDLGKSPLEPDMNQVNRQNKRKKVDENDGCKKCNCKKSKCLKLYCDCFAAGVYCADSCACQGCFNKPIYEYKVVETRQQIKSRNPIAFVPKVQQYSTSHAANNGDKVNFSTPDSVRHKRGCNCIKSLCQKKYCECYEGNVGCSLGCRCEGCQNIFGRKEDYKHTKDVVLDQNFIESNNTSQNEQPHNSPSLAPSFQHTGSKVGGNQYATTSPNEPFGIPISTIHQSQMVVTSSTKPSLGNSNNLNPENYSFPSTVSPQLRGCLTHISQFNGMKVHYKVESDNTIQRDNTPDILKDNFNHLSNSANLMSSPKKKRVSPPYTAQGIEHGSSSVPVIRSARKFILKSVSPLPPLMPMNDDGRHQAYKEYTDTHQQ